MSNRRCDSWKDVEAEVLRRIRTRVWQQGELIPNEADLAIEFGCSRSTVNRALRAVAESGLLERKRKAGTRVAANPAHKADFKIPVLRHEIEERKQSYSYRLIASQLTNPPAPIRSAMRLSSNARALHIRALHLADDKPFVYEDRWINSALLPAASKANFTQTNANEWLLANAPFTTGTITFSAVTANRTEAKQLGTQPKAALFKAERITWDGEHSITLVRLLYAPGYNVRMTI